ncbi:PREDICTED: RNA-binding protein 26 isoform X1 [Dinoponera quadriceps]|uniref:RNA-binding protein 26 isoform X1 n=3 Tax=Dinoponera quadriceps TaxID=609295 RepID=A0A6P3YB69_DINQU|nr:PREDICTED: RNA-binding protein 26 isoform X1 [Dinoponera quadriceps]
MIIDNPDQFKAWLTAVLEPLCDADPAALAKYVYALAKKDKTLEELRGDMLEQLDVFLQQETKNFVELLFKTLETQEYILPLPKNEPDGGGTTPPGTNPPAPVLPTEKMIDTTIQLVPMITNPPAPLQINGSAPAVVNKREARKSDSDKAEKEKEKRSRSRSGRMRSRTRSRSRSWERDRRRSRSREHIRRDRERDRSRPWRNESPPISTRRHDRRRTRSRSSSPIRPRIRDGPDNRDHRARFRNRSPTPLRSRSRSRSIERKKIMDRFEKMEIDRTDRIEGSPGGGTPTQDSNHGDVDMRLSTTSQSIQSVVAIASNISNNQTGSFQTKRRCRDFDEKGYCMRGDLCPYDHGTDPVVLEDVALSRVLTFGPHNAQAPGTVPVTTVPEPSQGPNGNAPPPHLPLSNLPPPHLRNHHSNMDAFAEYNPDAPSMEPRIQWGRHPQPGPGIYGRGQRELISVPVIPHTNSSEITHTQNNPLKRKQAFDFNRLGPKQRVVHNPANCSLELKKVPRSLNNITQLNNHFSKFGKIVNIQVNFGGDPEAALVTFQLPTEAKAAYRSTEAVLNNRFIKVFWHNNVNNNAASGAIENVPPGCRPSVKERLGAAVTLPAKAEDNEYVPTRRSSEEQITQTLIPTSPKTIVVATRDDKVLAIKKTQEILAAKETLKKKQEEKRKEALKLTADLRKRKQELLDKHLIELRALIEKAEKNPEQKDSIMPTIKAMQQSVDNLRKDLAANGQISNSKSQVKSREQTQKEILDAELDLMTAQQEGQDAGELQRRLNELRAQAAVLGLNTNPGVNRGTRTSRVTRGAHLLYRGRGRGSFTHVSVDHRPTSLLVSGYETEEKVEVLAHFQQFGEILNQIVDDATPSIVINFKSRKEAEVALVKGRTFQDRLLSITWVSGHHLHRGGAGSNSNAPVQLSSHSDQAAPTTDDDIDLEGTAEALLLEENEEEEDEDGESRSWRR